MINDPSVRNHCELRIGTGNYLDFEPSSVDKRVLERANSRNAVPRIHTAENKLFANCTCLILNDE